MNASESKRTGAGTGICVIRGNPCSSVFQIAAKAFDTGVHRFPRIARITTTEPSVLSRLASIFATLLLALTSASARDWIVHPGSGADSNDGTASAPLATVRAAMDRAGVGDRVVLQPAGNRFRLFPIGRDASGSPLLAWAEESSSTSQRVIHFGGEFPKERSSDQNRLGLVAPLDTASFPPTGPAFAPEQASAHAIWRWIGLTAPDAVFVPDTPEGRALGEALRQHAPAGVGLVEAFLDRPEPVVLPHTTTGLPLAKDEMRARVERGPAELLAQAATHYGDRFSGSYIEALAVIARAEGGASHRAAELAEAHLEKSPALPKNGGEIAGTLLYARIDEPWARERVLAVAEMAFDAAGEPLEAMPTHNEMSDAVFMASPVLAHAGRISGDGRHFDQALRNFRFIAGLCRRPDGLYRHSPLDEAAWGRGNGFPALGLALTLQQFPESREGYGEMRDALCDHLAALAPHQDGDGMWHQVVDRPDSYAELTATCMIAYAIAVALDEGWVQEDGWRARLETAWSAVKRHVSSDGRTFVNVCTGTGKQPSLEDYYLREAILGPDGRAAAMVMLLASKLLEGQGP